MNGKKDHAPNIPFRIRDESGVERIGGKDIPFFRTFHPKDYVVTTFGSKDPTAHMRDVSLIVRHDRPGRRSWGTVTNNKVITRGATRRFQLLEKTAEGSMIISTVRHLRQFPEGWNRDFPGSVAQYLIGLLQNAVNSGNTEQLLDLKKAIEGVIEQESVVTKGKRICDAVFWCVNNLARIPTKAEVQVQYENSCPDIVDEGNFSRDLRDAGWDWLPTRS